MRYGHLAHGVMLCVSGVLAVLFATIDTGWAESLRYRMKGTGRVVEVDTPNVIKIRFLDRDRVVRVRLLGVGSPRHSVRLKRLDARHVAYIRKHDFYETARSYVTSLLAGKTVGVRTRKWNRFDSKERLLAYLIIDNFLGEPVDVNGEIIRNGMGFVTRDYVHVTFAKYSSLEREARRHRRGIWQGLSARRLSLAP